MFGLTTGCPRRGALWGQAPAVYHPHRALPARL